MLPIQGWTENSRSAKIRLTKLPNQQNLVFNRSSLFSMTLLLIGKMQVESSGSADVMQQNADRKVNDFSDYCRLFIGGQTAGDARRELADRTSSWNSAPRRRNAPSALTVQSQFIVSKLNHFDTHKTLLFIFVSVMHAVNLKSCHFYLTSCDFSVAKGSGAVC